MSEGSAKHQWPWIIGAAVATFLIASVLPTAVLRQGVLLCLDVGIPPTACMAPVHGTADLTGSYITGLTMELTMAAKIVLALIAAGITAFALRRSPASA